MTEQPREFVPATDRQMAFITDLYKATDPDNADQIVAALKEAKKPLSKESARRVISDLVAKRDAAQAASTTGGGGEFVPATDRQMAFIASLHRALDPDNADEALLALREKSEALSKGAAQELINQLVERRDRRRSTPGVTVASMSEGFYKSGDGKVYQVTRARQGTHLLAKLLDEASGKFNYVGAAGRFVRADARRLTLEEAQEYGRRTGICMVCSRELTKPESVEAGIGPICAGRF